MGNAVCTRPALTYGVKVRKDDLVDGWSRLMEIINSH